MNRILIIPLLLLFASCKKEETSFKIEAVNIASGTPLSNLEYYITSTHDVNGSETVKVEKSGKLDPNGEALVQVKIKKGRTYIIRILEPDGICYRNAKSLEYKEGDGENPTFRFELSACAYIRYVIQNINCQGDNDLMNFRTRYSFTKWGNWSKNYSGCYNYAQYPNEVPAGAMHLEWKTKRNGITAIDSNNVYLSPGQLKTYYLYY